MTVELTKRPAAQPAFTDGNTNEDVYVVHRSYGAATIGARRSSRSSRLRSSRRPNPTLSLETYRD